MLHRFVGAGVAFIWFWILIHLHHALPGLYASNSASLPRASFGTICVLVMPLASAAMLIFPDFFARQFSPFSQMTNEPLLDDGFWVLVGYFSLLVSWCLFGLFR
jgi:hypothetical protein